MSSQSPRVPKFGDWDVGGESREQQFTLIFNNMRADKSTKRGNPNDPAFLAELLNPSSASSQAVVHDVNSPPPTEHESPTPLVKPTSMNHKINQYPQVPKFGEWDVDGDSGRQQEFTLIFDNMRTDKSMKGVNPNDPAFLSDFVNSSSPSQAAMHVVNQLPPPPLLHDRSRPPLKPTSRSSMNHKKVMAPKFGHWDVEHPKEYTAIFDELKQEKRHHQHELKQEKRRHQHASTHGSQTSTSRTTPLTTHKPFFVSWRLCCSSGHAVRD